MIDVFLLSSRTLTPHIRWAQRKDFVYLKVDIDGAVNPVVKLDSKTLSVDSVGSNGGHYQILLTFFSDVVPEVKKKQFLLGFVTLTLQPF